MRQSLPLLCHHMTPSNITHHIFLWLQSEVKYHLAYKVSFFSLAPSYIPKLDGVFHEPCSLFLSSLYPQVRWCLPWTMLPLPLFSLAPSKMVSSMDHATSSFLLSSTKLDGVFHEPCSLFLSSLFLSSL